MRSLTVNFIIALLWLLLSATPNLGSLLVGYVIGFLFLAIFRRLLDSEDYVRRTIALFHFVLIFLREMLISTFILARCVLFQSINEIDPDFIELDISGLTQGEALLLSHCITLTPGTTSVEISDDLQRMIVHALDASDPAAVREGIQTRLRDPILSFTRPWKSS